MSYPNHEKLKRVQPYSQAIGEFLEWLRVDQEVEFALHDVISTRNNLYPVGDEYTNEKLIARYYEIDLVELEKEKQEMLRKIREKTTP